MAKKTAEPRVETQVVPAETLPVPYSPGPDVDTSRTGVPFVTFISPKSARYADLALVIPGLKEPDAVLVRSEPERPLKLDPFRFHLVHARQFWVESEEGGPVVRVVTQRPEKYNSALKETVEAVVLAVVGDNLVPARVTFRTTKCPAVVTASRALKLAATPEWAQQSADHAKTLAVPIPYGRFLAVVSCSPRTARSTGRKFWQADARINPVTEADANRLAVALSDDGFRKALAAAADSYARRLAELERSI